MLTFNTFDVFNACIYPNLNVLAGYGTVFCSVSGYRI